MIFSYSGPFCTLLALYATKACCARVHTGHGARHVVCGVLAIGAFPLLVQLGAERFFGYPDLVELLLGQRIGMAGRSLASLGGHVRGRDEDHEYR